MPRTIQYYFTIASPWAYLGHAPLLELAKRHGARIDYRPMPIGEVFSQTGSLPLAKRPPARQRYRFVEMQRWRDRRGVPLTLKPAFVPFDADLANRCIVALAAAGLDPGRFAGLAFAGVWAQEKNLGDEAVVQALLTEAGHEPADVLPVAKSDETAAAYAANGAAAVEADVFGAPGYVLDGEVFWGQDRLDLLDDALASGRAPYRPV